MVSWLTVNRIIRELSKATGRSPQPTTVEHVKLIRGIVGERMKIKASGGIRTMEIVLAMKEAGVDRIGMSRSSAMAIFHQLPQD